jgi:hypothetical protein
VKNFISIDPGVKGGIAWSIMGAFDAVKMPETEIEIVKVIRDVVMMNREGGDEVYAIVEQVRGHIGREQPGHTMFIFGESFGLLKGALMGLSVPGYLREPQKWQRPFNLGVCGTSKDPKERALLKRIWKNKLKDEAQRRYPNLKVTLNTGDALLLLSYAHNFLSADAAFDF